MLSVIVATIPGRESLLSRCLHSITEQPGDYEVIVVAGTGGLGTKYNAAVAIAEGSHVTNVDDDDWLAADYMAHMLPLCETGVDYVGLKILALVNGGFWHVRVTTGAVKTWVDTDVDGQVVYPPQGPVPKGAIRRELAAQIVYGNRYAADKVWSADAATLVVTWEFADRCLYVYDYVPHRFGINAGGRDVGMWPFDEARVRRITVDAPRAVKRTYGRGP